MAVYKVRGTIYLAAVIHTQQIALVQNTARSKYSSICIQRLLRIIQILCTPWQLLDLLSAQIPKGSHSFFNGDMFHCFVFLFG